MEEDSINQEVTGSVLLEFGTSQCSLHSPCCSRIFFFFLKDSSTHYGQMVSVIRSVQCTKKRRELLGHQNNNCPSYCIFNEHVYLDSQEEKF